MRPKRHGMVRNLELELCSASGVTATRDDSSINRETVEDQISKKGASGLALLDDFAVKDSAFMPCWGMPAFDHSITAATDVKMLALAVDEIGLLFCATHIGCETQECPEPIRLLIHKVRSVAELLEMLAREGDRKRSWKRCRSGTKESR